MKRIERVESIEFKRFLPGFAEKPGTKRAELTQSVHVVRTYTVKGNPGKSGDNLFSAEEFGQEMEYRSVENRFVWLDVPESVEPEDMVSRLASHPNARLTRQISNHPILSQSQERAISRGSLTVDQVASRQVLRFYSGDKRGELILDGNGKVQYLITFLSLAGEDDSDFRTDNPTDMYLTPDLEVELGSLRAREAASRSSAVDSSKELPRAVVMDSFEDDQTALFRRSGRLRSVKEL